MPVGDYAARHPVGVARGHPLRAPPEEAATTAIKSVRLIVIELYARVRVPDLMAKAGGKLAERHCVS